MDVTIILWIAGVLVTALFTISGGAIAFILKTITDTLKDLAGEIKLTSSEIQGRVAILEVTLATLKAQHELCLHSQSQN